MLKTNFKIYFFGSLVEKAIPFLFLPYFTNWLGENEYSKLILFYTYSSLFSILIGISSDSFFIRELNERKFDILNLKAPFLYHILISLLVFIILLYFNVSKLLWFSFIIGFFQVIFNYCLAYFIGKQKPKQYVKLSIISTLATTILSIIFIYLYPFYESRVLSLFIGLTISIFYFLFISKRFIYLFFYKVLLSLNNCSIKDFLYFFKFSLPLGVHQGSFFLKNGYDKILMSNSNSTSIFLASYGLAFQLMLPFQVLFSTFNKAFLPHMYQLLNNKQYNKVLKVLQLSWIIVLISIVTFFIIKAIPSKVYVIIFGNDFGDLYLFLPWFISGGILTLPYFMSNFVLFYSRKTIIIAFLNFVSSIVHIIIFILLNSENTIEFLGASYFISQFFLFMSIYFISYKELKTLKKERK